MSQPYIDALLNDFAERSFRDVADGDYITARLACRSGLLSQFLWSSQQAIEKYLKFILLTNRIQANKIQHNIDAAMVLTRQLPFELKVCDQSRKFIRHVAEYGQYRYLEKSWYVFGYSLVQLDLAVWELRRYCQVLGMPKRQVKKAHAATYQRRLESIAESDTKPRHEFRIKGGVLEKILADRKHPAREALLWQNGCYGTRFRKTIRATQHLHAVNTPLSLHPEMLPYLKTYVYIKDA